MAELRALSVSQQLALLFVVIFGLLALSVGAMLSFFTNRSAISFLDICMAGVTIW